MTVTVNFDAAGGGSGGGEGGTWGSITGDIAAQTDLAAVLDTFAQPGLVGVLGTDVTSSRDLASTDFDGRILRINSGSVVAITVPTVSAMSLTATAGQLRATAFEIVGAGIPTFAGKTASTTINGTAGTTTVLPLGGAPVRYGHYVLTQLAVGGDDWSLE